MELAQAALFLVTGMAGRRRVPQPISQTISASDGAAIAHVQQFIVHGHIQISGRRVDVPGLLVKRGEEMTIDYYMGSPMAKEGHPERASRTPRVEG